MPRADAVSSRFNVRVSTGRTAMPTIRLSSAIPDSFRVQQILGMFDLPEDAGSVQLSAELPAAGEAWTIGAIVGPSGAGKTSVARAAFGFPTPLSPWPTDRPVIEGLGEMPLRQLLALLSAVGFNSPPAWLRPYGLLSSGEQFRCDVARRLAALRHTLTAELSHTLTPALSQREREILVLDEFTSHLDRDTARSCSFALQRYLRGAGLRPAQTQDRLKTCPTRSSTAKIRWMSCGSGWSRFEPSICRECRRLLAGRSATRGTTSFATSKTCRMHRRTTASSPICRSACTTGWSSSTT